MEPPEEVSSSKSSISDVVKKMEAGLESISCVYPNCRTSASVELFNVHLARCRRYWRGPVSICSYNGAHVIPLPEENYHMVTCSDRLLDGQVTEFKEIDVTRPICPEDVDAKKQAFDTFGIRKTCGRPYFDRGGCSSKWRIINPRLQNRYALRNEVGSYSSAGRGQHLTKCQRSSVTGTRSERRPVSSLVLASHRNPIASTVVDESFTTSNCGFTPWASPKSQLSLRTTNIERGNWTSPAKNYGRSQFVRTK